MVVDGTHWRTVWMEDDATDAVSLIDQRRLPFRLVVEEIRTVDGVAAAIREMHVRGAGCIGATAGFGMVLAAGEAVRAAVSEAGASAALDERARRLVATRPTAVNLRWAVERMRRVLGEALAGGSSADLVAAARREADAIADEDAAACRAIGDHGLPLIAALAERRPAGEPVRILTHCNAGWLAFVDWGSATAPIYAAHRAGIPVHVWVDETRPRNQGGRLTAWELANEGVPHTVIVDNAGGHLMQHGLVDLVVTGTDRTTATGDVANKIGTYLKALAARDNGIPFFAALPSSTFDWESRDGVRGIPIEARGGEEVRRVEGLADHGETLEVDVVNPGSPVANPAFDVTPARLVTGLITERGVCEASEAGIARLFPERVRAAPLSP